MKFENDKWRDLPNGIIFFICLFKFIPINDAIEASIDYEIDGDGFHRTIRYDVDTGNFFNENCYLALHLIPDPTLYVNVDELADLRRHGETTACADGEIDVELFAEKANSQNITICAPLKESANVLTLPIHQRYQLPRRNDMYVNVTLPQPLLLLGCKERIKEYRVSKIDLCSPCIDFSLKWREIPYKMKTKNYIWRIAVGNFADMQNITFVTLFTVCFGTIILLRTLWLAKDDKGNKND